MALSLAACGGGNNQSATSNPSGGGGGSDKPFAGQTLTVLYMSGVYADAARAMVSDFEEATGAKVEVVDFPYLTLHEKALLDLTSGTGSYDVIDVASQWDGEFAPFMEPLTDYISRDNYDMSVWIDNVLATAASGRASITESPTPAPPRPSLTAPTCCPTASSPPRKAFWDQDKMSNQKAVRDTLDTAKLTGPSRKRSLSQNRKL